ncbi:MAG TPA: NADH-quinone oxidoreductase subunit L [Candidatus Azoamicus sp. OHIO2]
MELIKIYIIIIVFAPLSSSVLVGLTCRTLNNKLAHTITTGMVFISTLFAVKILYMYSFQNIHVSEYTLYTWGILYNVELEIGFLIDRLTAVMLVIVSFISFLVHVYTIGYMKDDPGYNRFFAYISFFTFAMLMLVSSNNFIQLFFGWEGVGLASYLLIGFWFKKESAIFANLKAFIVNRIGDLGFLLGIAAIFSCFGTLNYLKVFDDVTTLIIEHDNLLLTVKYFDSISGITFISICLFIGAMGKSAQIPLHVWLPDSMEGPTPISALIHAATMVTAGIFMVARMSPIFEYSETTLIIVLLIGTLTCFLMGLLGIVQTDIKRIVAYSTLSQLGLMVAALGVSAYSAAIFHLVTHAFFKALLFLGSGAIIVALHHEQDIRNMGNLKKYMPITYATMLMGSLALTGVPGFSGFFSKDLIIESVQLSKLPYANIAYYFLIIGIFFTSFYSFRMFFLVFHTKERIDKHISHIKDCSWVITAPLIILAIFSVLSGWYLFNYVINNYFQDAIFIRDLTTITHIKHNLQNSAHVFLHGLLSITFLISLLGISTAWYLYCYNESLIIKIKSYCNFIYVILLNKYGFDIFNQIIIAASIKKLGEILWKVGDVFLIDKLCVNGLPFILKQSSKIMRHIQSGRLYNYVYIMITGFVILLFVLSFNIT